MRLRAHAPAHFVAVEVWHADIEQDDVRTEIGSRRARKTATSSAALLERLAPIGTVERINSATAGTSIPRSRSARHVITENARVLAAAEGVSAERFGALMNASHASLRDDFEVSVEALDVLVEILQAHADVHGARLTGAGFGGACVALARAGTAADVKAAALREFATRGYRGAALV